MKKNIVVVFFILSIGFANAQDMFKVQMETYKSALKYYDLPTAVTALYTAMAIKPERKDLRDSLVFIYFAGERFVQANAMAEDILKEKPNRFDLLEVAAVSKQSLGALKEALTDFEKVYKESKQVFHLYQIAAIQYQLKRYGEAAESLDKIIASPESETQKVMIRLQDNKSQSIIAKAAALNIKGIISLELNQSDVARQLFEDAIRLAPEFELPKGNLKLIDRLESEKKEAVSKGEAKPTEPAPAVQKEGKKK